jgi:hypothetical protein
VTWLYVVLVGKKSLAFIVRTGGSLWRAFYWKLCRFSWIKTKTWAWQVKLQESEENERNNKTLYLYAYIYMCEHKRRNIMIFFVLKFVSKKNLYLFLHFKACTRIVWWEHNRENWEQNKRKKKLFPLSKKKHFCLIINNKRQVRLWIIMIRLIPGLEERIN